MGTSQDHSLKAAAEGIVKALQAIAKQSRGRSGGVQTGAGPSEE
jgi:hypothetical protein